MLCLYAVQNARLRRFPSSIRELPTGAHMNVSFSYKHVDSQQAVAAEVTRRLDKLERFLKSYEPDLIQLHGVFSKNHRTDEQTLALTLSLPSGTLHAIGGGKNILAGCKNAFSDIEAQLKKHQSLLRREHEWKRKRPLQA
jgi:ribosomal subunit interface protein